MRIDHVYGASFWKPKSTQSGIQNESKLKTIFKCEKVALQEPLGAVLGRSWTQKCIRKPLPTGGNGISRRKLSKRFLDKTWPNLAAKSAENDPKMEPQNDSKSTKNRCQQLIEILIDFKSPGQVFLGSTDGMRRPLGGIIGGENKPQFQFCSKMQADNLQNSAT